MIARGVIWVVATTIGLVVGGFILHFPGSFGGLYRVGPDGRHLRRHPRVHHRRRRRARPVGGACCSGVTRGSGSCSGWDSGSGSPTPSTTARRMPSGSSGSRPSAAWRWPPPTPGRSGNGDRSPIVVIGAAWAAGLLVADTAHRLDGPALGGHAGRVVDRPRDRGPRRRDRLGRRDGARRRPRARSASRRPPPRRPRSSPPGARLDDDRRRARGTDDRRRVHPAELAGRHDHARHQPRRPDRGDRRPRRRGASAAGSSCGSRHCWCPRRRARSPRTAIVSATITQDGTTFLILGGLIIGLLAGTIWVVISPWIPGRGLVQGGPHDADRRRDRGGRAGRWQQPGLLRTPPRPARRGAR